MGSRKRSRSDAIAAPVQQSTEEPGLLQQIRSSWEFASLMQYIAIFGKIMKIDEDFEIEVSRRGNSAFYPVRTSHLMAHGKNRCFGVFGALFIYWAGWLTLYSFFFLFDLGS